MNVIAEVGLFEGLFWQEIQEESANILARQYELVSQYGGLPQIRGVDSETYLRIAGRRRSVLDLQIGDRCNLRCQYCFTAAGGEVNKLATEYLERTGREAPLLGPADHASILAKARSAGVRNLIISSEGESMLYKEHLLNILENAAGLGFTSVMFTNGTRIDSKMAHLLKGKVSIIGKINSMNPVRNDVIAGRQKYTYAMVNGAQVPDYIVRLFEAGYTGKDLALNMVVNRQNMKELPEFWFWARETATGVTPMGEFLELTGFALEDPTLELNELEIADAKEAVRRIDSELGYRYDALPSQARLLDMRTFVNPHALVVDSHGFVKDRAAQFRLDEVLGNVRDME